MSESSESISLSKKSQSKRVRSTNFNINETLLLEELVKENFDLLNSRLTNQVTNSMKSEIWKLISSKISALGYAHRTEQACIEKWANLKRKAKEDLTKEKLERRKTGGGSCIGASQQSQRIGDLLSNSAAFSGIEGGLDTDEMDGLHYLSNNKDSELTPQQTNTSESHTSPAKSNSNISQLCQEGFKYTVENGESTPSTSACGSKSLIGLKRSSRNKLSMHKQVKKSKSETLMDYQIAYFKGMVERQDLEKQLLEVKLRVMKAAESKLSELNAQELLNMLSEQ